jgi:predicted ATPase
MIHVLKYELKEPAHDGNVKPLSIEFRDGVNVFVGENGCGKSTVLKYMSDRQAAKSDCVNDKLTIAEDSAGVRLMYFDTEKHNPRMTGPRSPASDDVIRHLMVKQQSHGETLFPILNHIGKMENTVVFIDEPESGISLANQKALWHAMSSAAEKGCQVIIATHSYLFMQWAGDVFDMAAGKWMPFAQYADSALSAKPARKKPRKTK